MACSASGTGGPAPTGSSGTGGDGGGVGSGGTTGSGANGGNIGLDVPDSGQSDGAPAVCAGEVVEARPTPLDVLILLDQSSSMQSQSKWAKVTQALTDFVTAPEASGVRVALTYFAKTKPCNGNGDCQSWLGSCGADGFCTFDDYCNAADYVQPEVDFAELPGAANSLTGSLAAHSPLYNTPTPPALTGALQHARARAQADPSATVVVVLATDGLPDSVTCNIDNGDLPAVNAAAQAGLQGSPSIRTYVIGVGSQLSTLNQVAQAGGTGSAYIVDQGGATTAQFIAAMNSIREGASLPCEYLIPPPTGGAVDLGKVNVLYTSAASGGAETIFQVSDAGACGAEGGWHYDDPQSPSRIQMCPASCTALSAGGTIDIQLGCETQVVR